MKNPNCVLKIKERLHESSDLIERKVQFFSTPITILYIASLTDFQIITKSIMNPILSFQGEIKNDEFETLKNNVLANSEIKDCEDIDAAIKKILTGQVILCVGEKMLSCNAEKIVVRAVEIPPSSTVEKGPRQGFNESLKYNLALIRQRLITDKLVIKNMTVGKLTQTAVALCYLDNVVDKRILKEVEEKIKKIDIDGILDSSYISTYLTRKPNSIFKQIGDTEKPDILASRLLEGRIGIIVDGSPIVLTVPFILLEELQNENDYFGVGIKISIIRILRLVGILIAVLLPGAYVALQLYHYKIIPLTFLISIMNTTQGIPFSPFAEIIFVLLLFEILYEANLRMPQYLGLALSIVGALILGDTAVNAGLVSPPAVMIVAISGLTFYVIPSQTQQFMILRLVFTLVGTILGLFGILAGIVVLTSYLVAMDSYSSPYLAPLSPYIAKDQKDFLIKGELTDMKTRPISIANNRKNNRRLKILSKPKDDEKN